MRGCRPRVDGDHKATVIAQLEVSEGKVTQMIALPPGSDEPIVTEGHAQPMVNNT
jgi:hypothetical protein